MNQKNSVYLIKKCNIIKVFTVTLDQMNASLLKKNLIYLKENLAKPKNVNGSEFITLLVVVLPLLFLVN